MITWSTRDIDIEEIIGVYEFSPINRMMMSSDGRIHSCIDIAQLM